MLKKSDVFGVSRLDKLLQVLDNHNLINSVR